LPYLRLWEIPEFGIIRLSGEESFEIIKKIFRFKSKKVDITPNTIRYGHITSGDEIIDEVLVSFFEAPKSFTMENMCEINSHGGIVVMNRILELCLKNGAVLAEPRRIYEKSFFKWKNRFVSSRSCNKPNKC